MRSAEDQVLQLLEKLTPKGKCPLAGNSVGEVFLKIKFYAHSGIEVP